MENFDEDNDGLIVPSYYQVNVDLDNGGLPEFIDLVGTAIQDAYGAQDDVKIFLQVHSSSPQPVEVMRRVLRSYTEAEIIIAGTCSGYGVELILDLLEDSAGPTITIAKTASFLVYFPEISVDINWLDSPGTRDLIRAHQAEQLRLVSRLRYLGLSEASISALVAHKRLEIGAPTFQRMIEAIAERVKQ